MEIDTELRAGGRLRKARTADVLAMQRLINRFADRGAMLHRSLSELYENIRDFFVVEEGGEVIGCAALHVCWKDLAEIKSLAVAESYQGRGYGKRLIRACVREGGEIGLSQIFALTYVPDLFVKAGFAVVDKALLPRKVWTECVYCPKFPDCGEVAVLLRLNTTESGDHSPGVADAIWLEPRRSRGEPHV
ncbi:MAG: N-acetyltransferase [Chloroherpetonaceae bacterium]|nr:N-acetyltransferase [Chthonomonadaceae bacterium]MDW8207514.1 N-acetyltransferase [Chloroherpetonaceae bacterium]